ncbi:MAG: TSUP family transporter [bacterium JZ-2024 1]
MIFLIYILLGIVAGGFSGLLGIGGGLLLVPALSILFHFSQHQAQGTSLAVLLLPLGILGVWEYYREGHIQIPVALAIAAGFIVGAYFGAALATSISSLHLKKIFGAFLFLVSLYYIFSHQ